MIKNDEAAVIFIFGLLAVFMTFVAGVILGQKVEREQIKDACMDSNGTMAYQYAKELCDEMVQDKRSP